MQGAPKRTSGRSHPWSAPLRATSSVLYMCNPRAIRNMLKRQARAIGNLQLPCRNCSSLGKIYFSGTLWAGKSGKLFAEGSCYQLFV